MGEVDRWLRRQALLQGRGVLLEEAILGDRLWSYTRHRLRYFFLNYLVDTAVHTATVLLLFFDLSWHSFLPVVVTISATALVSNFWWGALEALRNQVRDLARSGKPHQISRVIGGWLSFALLISGAVLVLAVAWLAWRLAAGSLGAPDVYVAVLLLRLAVDVPTRCYHSGIYALRRIYKPLPAVIGSHLLELAFILTLYPLIGLWALVVSSVVLTAVLTTVTLVYTARVYAFVGHTPLAEIRVKAIRPTLRGTGRETLQAGGANAMIAVDSLVVLAMLYGAAVDSAALVVLLLSSPSIKASADWARLFYFDLKRLELRLFSNLRRRFERHTAVLAWLLGAAFWVFAVAVAATFYREAPASLYPALLVFFVSRSLLARVQIQAFAEAAYTPILGTGLMLVAGLATVTALVEGERALLTWVAVVTTIVAAVLAELRHRTHARGDPGLALLTLEWLQRLGAVAGPVRVGSALVLHGGGPTRADARDAEGQTRWRLSQLAEQAAKRLGSAGASAMVGPNVLVWFERVLTPHSPMAEAAWGVSTRQGTRDPIVTAQWLSVVSGGLTASVRSHECAGGEDALLVAGRHGLLGHASHHLLQAVLPVDLVAARRQFIEQLPGGVVYDPHAPAPEAFTALGGSELRSILVDAVAFARDLHVRRQRSDFDVTALCSGGELQLVFVADRATPRLTRRRWRQQVTRMNVRGAIGGARMAPHRGRSPLREWSDRRLERRYASEVAMLRRVPLLAGLGPAELANVAAAMTERRFAAGEEITRQGESGVGFFVIDHGEASVSVDGAEVSTLGPGDHFGELALIAETPRLATVTALTELVCHRMASWEFRRLVEGSAAISWHVLQATARLLYEERVTPHTAAAGSSGSGSHEAPRERSSSARLPTGG